MNLPKLKFTNTRKVLRAISRMGALGNGTARYLFFHGVRAYQERVYLKSTSEPFIEITTRLGCSLMCDFCPQDTLLKAFKIHEPENSNEAQQLADHKRLTLQTFKLYLEQIPENYILHFGGFSEPWLINDCTDMILSAHKLGYKIRVFTTLTGLSPEDVKRIHKIPFELFSVHLADESPSTRIKVNNGMIETLKAIEKHGLFQLEFHNHIGKPHPKFIKNFGTFDISTIKITDRAGNLLDDGKISVSNRIPGKIRCGFNPHSNELNHNVLLPNGDVLLCCEDYGLKHILGNLRQGPLLSMYDCEPYLSIKRGLDNETLDILCRHCIRAIRVSDTVNLQNQPKC